jgi:hypothetical protein
MTPPHFHRPALRASALALGLSLAFGATAQGTAPAADERAALTELRNTTLGLIEALVEQGLLTRAKADELLRRARASAAAPTASAETAAPGWGQPARPVVRVPYLSETARAQIKEDVRNDVLATARDEGWTDGRRLPGWVRSIVVDGDLRVRAQGEAFDENNAAADLFALQNITQESPAWAPDLTNTQHDRSRLTARARIGVTAKMSDTTSAGVRLATGGSSGSPASESQTLSGDFNRWGVGFDRAWLQWEPVQGDWLKAGRMAVPFDRSDLLWPDDLALDGVAGKAEWDFGPGVYGFAVGGAFPLEEFANSTHDKWLYGAQLGVDWASAGGDWQLRSALGIYNFDKLEGTRETDAPPVSQNVGITPYLQGSYPASVRQKGNTLINLNAPVCLTVPTTPGCASTATWGLASKFRPVDLNFAIVAKRFRPYELAVDVDIVRNIGFDRADIERRSGLSLTDLKEKTTGYQVRLGFGMPKAAEKGDWRGFVAYRHFERDAWVDAFTDSSWHGGGTNYKGFGVGAEYAFDHHATLGLRYFSTRELDDGVRYTDGSGQVRGNMSSAPLRIDTLQVETNVRF